LVVDRVFGEAFSPVEGESTALFLGWATEYHRAFAAAHPLAAAEAAAALIEEEDAPLPMRKLTTACGLEAHRLRGAFKKRFGMSIRVYRSSWRALGVVRLLADDPTIKRDALALLAGYRSKKNMYRAVRSLAGLEPGELASQGALRSLALRIEAALRGGAFERRKHGTGGSPV
jgi:AraC-like DNA-binding protein